MAQCTPATSLPMTIKAVNRPEKTLAEGVDCDAVAGFDEETNTLYVVAYNFKFDLNYNETADVSFTIDAPFWKNKTLEFAETTIDDSDNFFCKWLEDKEKYQIGDDAFHWSPDSGCLDSGLRGEARDLYFNTLRAEYVKIANTAPETEIKDVSVGSDGKQRVVVQQSRQVSWKGRNGSRR